MTTTDTKVQNLIINTMDKATYDTITPSDTELYMITDEVITGNDVINGLGYTPADTSISNLTDTGKVTVSHLTCPSFTKYKTITLGASGTSYQAPADGWFSYVGSASSAGRVDFSSSVAMYDSRYTMPGEWCGANIRVAKGQSVTFYYNGTFSIGSFRFIYDIGTESEYS
jgi:hypothetical protein